MAIIGLLTSARPATATALAVAAPVVPVLRWHRCNDVKGFDRATARVPLDYRNLHGSTITPQAAIPQRAAAPGGGVSNE